MTQDFVAYAIEKPRDSKSLKSGRFYKIEFLGLTDCLDYNTFIDPEFRNYKHWQDVIDLLLAGHSAIISFDKLHFSNGNGYTIDADCKPILEDANPLAATVKIVDEFRKYRAGEQVQKIRKVKQRVAKNKKEIAADVFNNLFRKNDEDKI
jgi:hypothetical protein